MGRLLQKETIARIYMNYRLRIETLRGNIADIGGGHSPNYFAYLQREEGISMEACDGSFDGIDFEKDRLPYVDGSIDTVLLFNVLEHIYNYQFLVSEVKRITKVDGQVLGFVPFWVGYHPDPHDYFRYTRESLTRIFEDAGFKDVHIEALGGGPFLANFNTIMLSFPRVLRPFLFIPAWILDSIFVRLRPQSVQRNPLGFFFKLSS